MVAIWAPLRYTNYGDDMQAIALGKLIQSIGYDVKLFQLDESLAKQYDMRSVSTIDSLCEDVNLCIIAGGALLTPFNPLKRVLNRSAAEYEQDFKDLLKASEKFPIKFCAISMGGDGKVRMPWMYYSQARIKFFKSDAFLNGTVRLAGDVKQMKQFGKEFVYHPDMLFRSFEYFEYNRLEITPKYRVGINFKKGKYLDKKLLSDIYEYAAKHDDIEFHFTTTHMQKKGLNYQYIPKNESKNIFIHHYESPNQLLGVLASMDIFITSMLHLGLTGLTTGTPFISYRGPGKTKSFLESIGGHWAIVKDDITLHELKKSFFAKKREELYSQYDKDAIQEMINSSTLQYEFCKKLLEKLA